MMIVFKNFQKMGNKMKIKGSDDTFSKETSYDVGE